MKSSLSKQVLGTIKRQKMLHAGDRLGVAVSGGADSVALLLLLLGLREEFGIVLSVVHFNHKLRGKASDADEKFVGKLASKHKLVFHAGQSDVRREAAREKINLEDAARRARYSYFERLVKEDQLTHVATAHTADDQAETVLAHILRGTGLAGLGAIHPIAGNVIRPLLNLRRTELRTYLKSAKQTWREDASNRDTTRTRARIREELIPLLEKRFQPAVVAHLTRLAEFAREDEAFLDALVKVRLREISSANANQQSVRIGDLLKPWAHVEFANEETPLLKRLLRQRIEEAKNREGQITANHVDAVMELVLHGENGKSLELPGGVEVRRDRDVLVFCAAEKRSSRNRKKNAKSEYQYDIEISGGAADVCVPQLGCVFRFRVIDWPPQREETNMMQDAVLDRDRMRFPLVLRNWRPGDRFQPAGRRNAHKIKRLLSAKHVNRGERSSWPVLVCDGVLAWARGFPVAAKFAPDEKTRTGILIAEEPLT